MNEYFKELVKKDERILTKKLPIVKKLNDPNHYQRRKQQRAITDEMVALCLSYGEKKRIRGALTYTLLDKNIKYTKYKKYLSKLRGLRVVLNNIINTKENNKQLGIQTVYWVYSVKKNK